MDFIKRFKKFKFPKNLEFSFLVFDVLGSTGWDSCQRNVLDSFFFFYKDTYKFVTWLLAVDDWSHPVNLFIDWLPCLFVQTSVLFYANPPSASPPHSSQLCNSLALDCRLLTPSQGQKAQAMFTPKGGSTLQIFSYMESKTKGRLPFLGAASFYL